MRRALTLFPTVGIFTILTTGILVSVPKSVSAYCVHNLTGGPIKGEDAAKGESFDLSLWSKDLAPDQKDCCPSENSECQNRIVRIWSIEGSKGTGECVMKPGDRGLIEVRYENNQMVCNVR